MGNRILAALLLFMFVLCSAGVFVILSLSMIGVEVPMASDFTLPKMGNVFLSAFFLFLAVIASQVVSFWFAGGVKGKVHSFFDSRWLPRKGSAETYTTSFGERLEKVVSQSYYGTTVWDMATKTIPLAFTVSFIAGAVVLIAIRLAGGFPWLAVLPLVLVINLIVIPVSYWHTEWVRKYTKFIVFSFNTLYIKARTPVLSLFFWRGTLPQKSETPISGIKDTQIAADPQQFDPKFRTSWARDQYISWLSEKTGLRTLFIRSKTNEAEDTLFWVDRGPGLDKILRYLRDKVPQVQMERTYIQQNAVRLRTGNGEDKDWRPVHADIEAESYLNRFAYEPVTYDVYRVEDPGIYDDQGNPKGPEKEISAPQGSRNVAEYFSSRRTSDRKRRAEPPKDQQDSMEDNGDKLF